VRKADAAAGRARNFEFGWRNVARRDGIERRPRAQQIALHGLMDALGHDRIAHCIERRVERKQLG
jgi:hypothetical protein